MRQLFFCFLDFVLNNIEVCVVVSAVADGFASAVITEAVATIISACLESDLEVLLEKAVKHSNYSTDSNDSAYNDKQRLQTVRVSLSIFVHNVLLSPSKTE